jgi:hypothetical protein
MRASPKQSTVAGESPKLFCPILRRGDVIAINSAIELKASIVVASIIRVAPVSRSMALEPAEKQVAKEYLAPNCVPKDTVPFEVPHCLRRR